MEPLRARANLAAAETLVTSRLALVESARALARLRMNPNVEDSALAKTELALESIWSRCAIWELSEPICRHASSLAPKSALRTLDAIHLATFLAARKVFEDIALLTTDERRAAAAGLG
jgi:predicted nucleic acid-binding protein